MDFYIAVTNTKQSGHYYAYSDGTARGGIVPLGLDVSEAHVFTAHTQDEIERIRLSMCAPFGSDRVGIIPVQRRSSGTSHFTMTQTAQRDIESEWFDKLAAYLGSDSAAQTFLRVTHYHAQDTAPAYRVPQAVQDYRAIMERCIEQLIAKCAPIALNRANARFTFNLQLRYEAARKLCYA